MMDASELFKILPHKPPILMADRILELIPGEKVVGIKVLGINEPYFAGHFPGNPIMPGVLLIEVINQVGAVAILSTPKFKNMLPVFAGCNNVRFKRPAYPGDVLLVTVNVLDSDSKIGFARGKIEVDGKVICEADILFYMQQ
jgi:3-hydroxyacyl-[acyl-carrier-protein] dehydratase